MIKEGRKHIIYTFVQKINLIVTIKQKKEDVIHIFPNNENQSSDDRQWFLLRN